MRKLTAKFIKEVETPGKYYDCSGSGLYLIVQRHKRKVRKSFAQRITIHGRRHDIGLGSIKWRTLSEARLKAHANMKTARDGGDPLAHKRRNVPTFEEAVETVIAIHKEGWRDKAGSERQWRASLRDYAIPRLGHKRVDKITTADVMAVLSPHWHTKAETMRRVRQRIGAVMKWATAQCYRGDNPAGDAIAAALPRNNTARQNLRALPFEEVPDATQKIRQADAGLFVKLALEFLVLTAARSGEVRHMTWNEVDMDAAIWTVPAERMKAGREHRVPLSDAAVDILRNARDLNDGSRLVFPSTRGVAIRTNLMPKILDDCGIDAVPHGFRSSFRDWAAEKSTASREVCELALAHVNTDRAEAAYRRTDLFEKRRTLMQAWADYVTEKDSVVVRLRS